MKKLLTLILALMLVIGSVTGCSSEANSSGEESSGTNAPAGDTSQGTESQTEDSQETGEVTYPLVDDPIELSYYIRINDAMSATMETYGDVEFFKMLEEKTNVKIQWDHNTSTESFAAIISSGQYPDLINWVMSDNPGGMEAMLEDGVIVDISEMIPQYAPAYWAWMQANPSNYKSSVLSDGRLVHFSSLQGDWSTMQFFESKILGPMIRQDWLDQLGMEMPTTTDELFDVLIAFRDHDMNGDGDATDETPFVVSTAFDWFGVLGGSFGARLDIQKDGDKVVYGPTTENFKKLLEYVHRLYEENLINTDFAIAKEEKMNLITQNKSGFAIGSMNSTLIANHQNLQEQNPEYNLVSVPWLIGPDGYQCDISDKNSGGQGGRRTVVTTACENVEVALRWLDYAYTEQGSLEMTFGIEGESFEMVDGYPTIKEEVKQNDKGWTEEQSICRWMCGPINYPGLHDYRFYEQMSLNEPYKEDIQTNWSLATDDIIFDGVVMTADETAAYNAVMPDIKTYVETSYMEFIVGDKSLDTDWDAYVETVNSMGIDQALTAKQAAYDRFLAG